MNELLFILRIIYCLLSMTNHMKVESLSPSPPHITLNSPTTQSIYYKIIENNIILIFMHINYKKKNILRKMNIYCQKILYANGFYHKKSVSTIVHLPYNIHDHFFRSLYIILKWLIHFHSSLKPCFDVDWVCILSHIACLV